MALTPVANSYGEGHDSYSSDEEGKRLVTTGLEARGHIKELTASIWLSTINRCSASELKAVTNPS